MDEKKISTTVRFDPAFHESLRIEIAKRRLRGLQTAIDQALRLWLQQQGMTHLPPPTPPVPPGSEPLTEWHEKLTEILASGDEAAISAVKAQIDLVHARLRPIARKRKAG